MTQGHSTHTNLYAYKKGPVSWSVGKDACHQAWQPEFNAQNPEVGTNSVELPSDRRICGAAHIPTHVRACVHNTNINK